METNDDEVIVLCGPMDCAILPGSKVYKCSKCGEDCTCSTIGQKQLDRGAKALCPKCGRAYILKWIADGKPPTFMDPTEAIKMAQDFIDGQKNN